MPKEIVLGNSRLEFLRLRKSRQKKPSFSRRLLIPNKFGGGDPKLCEPEPLTSKVSIAALWKREQLDLAELARLRWVEKWSNQRLADYFGVSPASTKQSLRRIKADPAMVGLSKPPPVIRGRP